MMCHRMGVPPISTIGFGRDCVSSLIRVPSPPARMTAFILSQWYQRSSFGKGDWVIIEISAPSISTRISRPTRTAKLMLTRAELLRKQILDLTAEYHAEAFPQKDLFLRSRRYRFREGD